MIIKLLFKTAPLLVFVSLMFLFGKAVYADDISCRLIVYSQEDDTVADDENLIAGYEDVYILQYDTSEEAEEALTYYNDSSAIAELDTSVNIAEGTSYSSSDPEMVMTEEDNPLTRLEELVDTADLQLQEYFDIALIDTGCSTGGNVKEAVSVTGDLPGDDNGHGNKMAEYIKAVFPDASILSIKALDKNGCGDISSVYAAIRYAVSRNVRIINLSLSAEVSGEGRILKMAVDEAAEEGVIVVASAGNNGKDALGYTPGNIDRAIVAGSAAYGGRHLAISNYGYTVDLDVVSSSTSEAAARLSGAIAARLAEGMGPDEILEGFEQADPYASDIFRSTYVGSSVMGWLENLTEVKPHHTLLDHTEVLVKEVQVNAGSSYLDHRRVDIEGGILTFQLTSGYDIDRMIMFCKDEYVYLNDYRVKGSEVKIRIPDNFDSPDWISIYVDDDPRNNAKTAFAAQDTPVNADNVFYEHYITMTGMHVSTVLSLRDNVEFTGTPDWGQNLAGFGMALFWSDLAPVSWGSGWKSVYVNDSSGFNICAGDIVVYASLTGGEWGGGLECGHPNGHVAVALSDSDQKGTYQTLDQTGHTGYGVGDTKIPAVHTKTFHTDKENNHWEAIVIHNDDADKRAEITAAARQTLKEAEEHPDEWISMIDAVLEGISSSSCYIGVEYVLNTEPAEGSISLVKTSEGADTYNLTGAFYAVYSDSALSENAVDISGNKVFFITDKNGTGHAAYRMTQAQAERSGYTLLEDGNTTGCVYLVYSGGSSVYCTDLSSADNTRVSIEPGKTYYAAERQTTLYKRHSLSTDTGKVTVSSGDTAAFRMSDPLEPIRVKLIKGKVPKDSDISLKGALYSVYDQEDLSCGYFITDENGKGYVAGEGDGYEYYVEYAGIRFGTSWESDTLKIDDNTTGKSGRMLYIKEAVAPKGGEYGLDETVYTLNADRSPARAGDLVIFDRSSDSLLNYKIAVRKTDAKTGNVLAGCSFLITDTEDPESTFSFITGDDEDHFLTDGFLIPGHTYIFSEEEAPDGYIRWEDTLTFYVESDGSITFTEPLKQLSDEASDTDEDWKAAWSILKDGDTDIYCIHIRNEPLEITDNTRLSLMTGGGGRSGYMISGISALTVISALCLHLGYLRRRGTKKR